MNHEVIGFINDFKKRHPLELEDVFYNGYCYYFALMLKERFGGTIMFNENIVHFALWLCEDKPCHVYDIKGIHDISNNRWEWWPWDEYRMHNDIAKEISESCIIKKKKESS